MLPDFATMSGARLAEAHDDAGVTLGIALHHRTDGAFHHLPPVLALMRELDDRLERAGCARGPRRAVAHIGVELLLDGVLVEARLLNRKAVEEALSERVSKSPVYPGELLRHLDVEVWARTWRSCASDARRRATA